MKTTFFIVACFYLFSDVANAGGFDPFDNSRFIDHADDAVSIRTAGLNPSTAAALQRACDRGLAVTVISYLKNPQPRPTCARVFVTDHPEARGFDVLLLDNSAMAGSGRLLAAGFTNQNVRTETEFHRFLRMAAY